MSTVPNTPAKDTKSRGWCATINNHVEDDEVRVKILAEKARYAIAGREVGESGTPHLQCYFYFDNARAFSSMKNALPGAHLEPAKGTAAHNKTYCSKDGSLLIEHGADNMPKQGDRTDIQSTYDHLNGGGNMRELLDREVNHQCLRVAETWLKYKESPKTWKPEVVWYYGESGAGKSHAARATLSEGYWESNADNGGWMDGYDAHDEVFLDDIGPDWFPWKVLLRMLGQEGCNMRVKGGFRQFKPRRIVITSIQHPEEFAQLMKTRHHTEPIYQLLRRITEIVNVQSTVEPEAMYMPKERTLINCRSAAPSEFYDSDSDTSTTQGNTSTPELAPAFVFSPSRTTDRVEVRAAEQWAEAPPRSVGSGGENVCFAPLQQQPLNS